MKKKVLVIEDNSDIRENVVEILELADFTVFEADNGKKGPHIRGPESGLKTKLIVVEGDGLIDVADDEKG